MASSYAFSRIAQLISRLGTRVPSLVDQPTDFIQLLPRYLFVLQQVRNETSHIAAEHTVQQVARSVSLEFVFLHERKEHKGSAVDFMVDRTLVLQRAEQRLHRA